MTYGDSQFKQGITGGVPEETYSLPGHISVCHTSPGCHKSAGGFFPTSDTSHNSIPISKPPVLNIAPGHGISSLSGGKPWLCIICGQTVTEPREHEGCPAVLGHYERAVL